MTTEYLNIHHSLFSIPRFSLQVSGHAGFRQVNPYRALRHAKVRLEE